MTKNRKEKLISLIKEREKLRPLNRFSRLVKDPIRAFPFYILAILGHVKPFPVSFKTFWNTRMECFLPEGNTFYYYGYSEANLTNFFLRYIEKGMVCIDIGAHVGFYTTLLSELVEKEGKIHSFEPTPWTFNLLAKNTSNLTNLKIHNLALSDKEQSLSFADYGTGYGAFNSAHPEGAQGISKKAKMIHVESISLDSYCKENKVKANLIKIDAEGFEANILEGMKDLLSPGLPSRRPVITLEVAGGDAWVDNRMKAFQLLSRASYLPYSISVGGLLSAHNFQKDYKYDNLVFIPSENKEEFHSLIQS